MSDRVLAAVSGGVDSAVAAHLLKNSGREVLACTLQLMPCSEEGPQRRNSCCAARGIESARRICDRLGIPHSVVDMTEVFEREIVSYFLQEYSRGRTPNPCVVCNREIKFSRLLGHASGLGCERLATGHYARVETSPGGRHVLKKGADPAKDQSYFLSALRQDQLRIAEFPLGEMTKEEARKIASEAGILQYVTPESQEICFVQDESYHPFLRSRLGKSLRPGPVYDTSGKKLGEHEGIELYTIGQRRGLGIAGGKPLYVVDIRTEDDSVILGGREEAMSASFDAENPNWIYFETPPESFEAVVKIRYLHPGAKALVETGQGTIAVRFEEPQFAVTPGQLAVFCDGDTILGSATISK